MLKLKKNWSAQNLQTGSIFVDSSRMQIGATFFCKSIHVHSTNSVDQVITEDEYL